MEKYLKTKTNRVKRVFSAEIIDEIKKGSSVLICTHVSPDGDTIGSAIGLQLALESMSKKVVVACSDPVPAVLNYLNKADQIALPKDLSAKDFDLAIAVDVSDELRLGDCGPLFFAVPKTIQIDHHGTNPNYAQLNYVDESASATGILMFDLIEQLSAPLTQDIAIALYTGLAIDTGNFSFDNTSPEALEVASRLVACEVPVGDINRALFREKKPEQIRLLAKALSHLTFYDGGRVAGLWLSDDEMEAISTLAEYTDGIVNYAMDVTGVKMAFFAKEQPEGVKFSLRSIAPYDVAAIASQFHGGGHPRAAGCTIYQALDKAINQMVEAMVKNINQTQETQP